MTPELGVIEGRFGPIWSWEDRTYVMSTLASAGYRFFHYGPKADRHLRRTFREPHPPSEFEEMSRFAAECRSRQVRFGVALTPMDAYPPLAAEMRRILVSRLKTLQATGMQDLAILFDDLRGDIPELAEMQIDIVHLCASVLPDCRIFFCPTYYSDDPLLDRVFGTRPPDYFECLSRSLDPSIQIYWTGEEVCSREISPGHLRDIADRLGRKVCLWDNYPVNDGSRMSRFLHLRAFTGRSKHLSQWLSGHAINPAVQPVLTCIPALTLPELYNTGDEYRYTEAFRNAAKQVLGVELAAMIEADLQDLCDVGWERLGPQRAKLMKRYQAINSSAAGEVVRWLEGLDLMSDEEVQTQ